MWTSWKLVAVVTLVALALPNAPAYGDGPKCATKHYGTSSITVCDEGAEPRSGSRRVPRAATEPIESSPSVGDVAPPQLGNEVDDRSRAYGRVRSEDELTEAGQRYREERDRAVSRRWSR